jgi:predicted CopG family antitoxin
MVNTTIAISLDVKERLVLRRLTKKESYNEILIRLLDKTEYEK